jgi:hypothetical protein
MERNFSGRPRCAPARGSRRHTRRAAAIAVELLESRDLLSTFTVTSLRSSGAGSFRQALIAANAHPGPDTIAFKVAGTVRINGASLPAISGPVAIDGTKAPSFDGRPVVTIDFAGTAGLRFAPGSRGSSVIGLALVRAGGPGITLSAPNVTIQGDDIGLRADGLTKAGNRGDGIRINASSNGDLIGQNNPVSSIDSYQTAAVTTSQGPVVPVSSWTGIRPSSASGLYLMTGTSESHGLLYEGPISGVRGTGYLVDYPSSTSTVVTGIDNLGSGQLRLVGTYDDGLGDEHGFVFQGSTGDLGTAANYQELDVPGAIATFPEGTMGGLVVGNTNGVEADLPAATGEAFIADAGTGAVVSDVDFPGAIATTAQGIWYNGGTSFTICGGYLAGPSLQAAIEHAYLVDFDSSTQQFSHWASFDAPTGTAGASIATSFQGISSTEAGVFTLAADSTPSGAPGTSVGSWVSVRLNTDGSFGPAAWVNLNGSGQNAGVAGVFGYQLVGTASGGNGQFAYQNTINVGFQLSNVISGNGGNGIGIYGSSGDQIAMNAIGTDVTGTKARANGKNGIFVTQHATANLIGGQATGGNDPVNGDFVRPPDGNLISGNQGDGVLITGRSSGTVLSGNFIGTSTSGNGSLANRGDGVAISRANGNQLLGCTYQQSPFVFYNVISGNRGNGVRITNSNNTTVQANFMGVGADNATIVANQRDGLLVSGSSTNTQVGGVIPLGNVIAGNDSNGLEVSGSSSGLVSFNTFAGVYAFGGLAPNKGDGILVTSRGGNNLIRTCIVSGNLRNGIEIAGSATGVQVTDTAAGTDTKLQSAIPNHGNGILIAGRAHGIVIGGRQPSVEPQVTVSSNLGYGIKVAGSAYNVTIVRTFIGTNGLGNSDLGNRLGGIDLAPGTSRITVSGSTPSGGVIVGNSKRGPGILVDSSNGDSVAGAEIENNAGDGITVVRSRRLTVGGVTSGAGNQITGNLGYGVFARGDCRGSVIRGNTIAANGAGNVNTASARGIVYIP